jgi:hypothetical protein
MVMKVGLIGNGGREHAIALGFCTYPGTRLIVAGQGKNSAIMRLAETYYDTGFENTQAIVDYFVEHLTVGRIVVSVSLLLAAVLLSMLAGWIRNKPQQAAKIVTGLSTVPKEMTRAVLILVLSSLLEPGYTIGLSYRLKSITQPHGLAPLPFMAVLCTGAMMGSFFVLGTMLTIHKQWSVFITHGFVTHRLSIIAGFAHYGGNIIHTFATRNLSAVVSLPLGFTAGLWTTIWGLVFGEFEGSPRCAYALLAVSMFCYLCGAFLIANIS